MRPMRKAIVIPVLLVSTLGIRASAGAQELVEGHGIGLGVQENLGGLVGATIDYDAGRFRLEGILGFDHQSGPSVTTFGIGGRFFWVVHHMERADLGLGGGLALVRQEAGGASENNFHIELGGQIRAFLTSNVALSGMLGVVIVTAENFVIGGGPVTGGGGDGHVGVGGQLLVGFGVTYYFR